MKIRYFESAVELVDLLRRNTVEVVEKVAWWRTAQGPPPGAIDGGGGAAAAAAAADDAPPRVFLWNGVNYLSKVSGVGCVCVCVGGMFAVIVATTTTLNRRSRR